MFTDILGSFSGTCLERKRLRHLVSNSFIIISYWLLSTGGDSYPKQQSSYPKQPAYQVQQPYPTVPSQYPGKV